MRTGDVAEKGGLKAHKVIKLYETVLKDNG